MACRMLQGLSGHQRDGALGTPLSEPMSLPLPDTMHFYNRTWNALPYRYLPMVSGDGEYFLPDTFPMADGFICQWNSG